MNKQLFLNMHILCAIVLLSFCHLLQAALAKGDGHVIYLMSVKIE